MTSYAAHCILGIDPGNTHTAGAFIRDGIIVGKFYETNQRALEILRGVSPDCRVVCEMIASYGMAVGKTVFDTCVMIGRIQAIFPDMERVTRIQVKTELCKSARAKDGNVRQALIDIYGPPGTKKAPGGTYGISGDQWAALAVATAAANGCNLYQ